MSATIKREWRVERAMNTPTLQQVLNDLEGRGWTVFGVLAKSDGVDGLQHFEIVVYKDA